MRITADTTVLVRALTGDDPRQSRLAQRALEAAEAVALPIPVLCELVWVLRRGYGIPAAEIADAIRRRWEAHRRFNPGAVVALPLRSPGSHGAAPEKSVVSPNLRSRRSPEHGARPTRKRSARA